MGEKRVCSSSAGGTCLITIPNVLSFLRMPLAFVFLSSNATWRAIAVLLALLTDGLDGYIARRTQAISRLGTLLDPLTDRFFVFFAFAILSFENHLEMWKIFALLSRDGAILLFVTLRFFQGTLSAYAPRALLCGKITTVLQLVILFGLNFGVEIPNLIYQLFFFLGLMALGELFLLTEKRATCPQQIKE